MDHAVLDLPPALATGDGGDAAAAAPNLPALVLADLVGRQSGPLAKIELDHILAVLHRQRQPLGEDLGGFAGPLQWARIDRNDVISGQASGHRGDFGATSLG